ncbi:MAG: CBS domain-containing protein [Sphingomonadales bacterium]|nr:MAG: CBS domain-containing protein [Sphingomonadales bacterium]
MFVSDLTQETRARFRTLDERRSVRDAAGAFADAQLGLLIVCTDTGEASGVVSKSDLVRHLARSGNTEAPLAEVMSRAVVFASAASDLRQTWQLMVQRRLQNLPLLGASGRPIGTLDIRDALEAILSNEERQESELINYIAGNGYR